MISAPFTQYSLDLDTDIFNILSKSTVFDDIAKGRKGAILLDNANNLIPIVRTTSPYSFPAQKFSEPHYDIIRKIKKVVHDVEFNNGAIEIYNCDYKTMKYHSDQALDLEADSFICLFSCYSNPQTMNLRKLKIKEKGSIKENEIILKPNSIVIFSTSTNKKYVHKIVLDSHAKDVTQWLGLTLRKSKTFIKFVDEIPYFENNKILRIANDEERKEFMIMKGKENQLTYFEYPDIDFTTSPSDLMKVI
jgi:hypothetical protein